MNKWKAWVVGLLACAPLGVATGVDLESLDREMTGARAQVMVLGTAHLGQLKDFNPAGLSGLLDRLAGFKPDIITIESLPGVECDLAARYAAKYGKEYCDSTEAAKAATGLELAAALIEVDKTLKTWPAEPTAAQRRHLAALFLAANDPASALVQWLRLPEGERRAGDGLDAALVARLGKVAASNNENYQLGSRLAVRLGLERVFQVDNHTGDNVEVANVKAFEESVLAAWKAGVADVEAQDKRVDELARASDLIPMYRLLNEPGSLQVRADVNVRAALRAKSPEGYPQMWVAGWEIRNLRMVANIRETFRERPGARVLSIVGASHKPWFDNWLGQLQGVDIVDVEALLK